MESIKLHQNFCHYILHFWSPFNEINRLINLWNAYVWQSIHTPILVDDLLLLTDKYDFAIAREKCVEFVTDCKDDPFFQLLIADKHELKEAEVKIQVY